MSTINPFERKSAKPEVADEEVDKSAEVLLAQIESAENRLNASTSRLQEALAKPVNEQKIEEPDTQEKIYDGWKNAKLRAVEAFAALNLATLGVFVWTGETYNAGQAAIGTGDLESYTNLSQRLSELQVALPSIMVASMAVPLVMLGMNKLSKMRREKNLNQPATT